MPVGRFANLEFEGTARESGAQSPQGGSPNALRDCEHYLEKARTCEFMADDEGALRNYSAALGEDPTALDAWLGQLWILYELGEYPEVDLWTQKAMEQFPENPALLAMRSLAAMGEGKKIEARGYSDAALGKKGEHESIWLARADVMLEADSAVGEECFVHAHRLSNRPGLTALRIARICVRRRRLRLARKELLKVTASQPEASGAWNLLATVQWELGDEERARRAAQQAVELAPLNQTFKDTRRRVQGKRPGALSRFFRRSLGK